MIDRTNTLNDTGDLRFQDGGIRDLIEYLEEKVGMGLVQRASYHPTECHPDNLRRDIENPPLYVRLYNMKREIWERILKPGVCYYVDIDQMETITYNVELYCGGIARGQNLINGNINIYMWVKVKEKET